MNKLKLQLDDLTVDSFDTSAVAREKGTVVAEQCTCGGPVTCAYTCPVTCDDATCAATCYNTCDDPTCVESCYWRDCQETLRGDTCRCH